MSSNVRFELSGVQAWPTMFFVRRWKEHPLQKDAIVSLLRQLQSEQRQALASGVAVTSKSTDGLFEGDFDLFANDHKELGQLVQFLRTTLAKAVCIANGVEARPQDVFIEFVDSWYHITNGGGFHDAHWHHGCSWCGIYYLQLGQSEQSGGTGAPNGGSRFYCPLQTGGAYRDFGNRYLSTSMDAPIEDGMLLLFPSYLLHSGLPYRGEVDRIVLAFNARVALLDESPLANAVR